MLGKEPKKLRRRGVWTGIGEALQDRIRDGRGRILPGRAIDGVVAQEEITARQWRKDNEGDLVEYFERGKERELGAAFWRDRDISAIPDKWRKHLTVERQGEIEEKWKIVWKKFWRIWRRQKRSLVTRVWKGLIGHTSWPEESKHWIEGEEEKEKDCRWCGEPGRSLGYKHIMEEGCGGIIELLAALPVE